MDFLTFIRKHPRFLAFGFLMTWFSSFGQTFFIALFSADIRAAFGLSHSGFGSIYAGATLASGLCMIGIGRRIDFVDLRRFSVSVCIGLILACFFLAVVPSLPFLVLAIFALRLTGQGLMSHTSATSMARYFDDQRGKALSVSTLGRPAGEFAFPLLAVALNQALGWRLTWTVIGWGLLAVLIPLVLWLLKGHDERHRRLLERASAAEQGGSRQPKSWTRREVLADLRFYLMLPTVVAPSMIMTGFFFHQVHLVESKGWSLAWFAFSYTGHAAATVAASLFAGPLVDRVGAVRLLPFYLIPLGVALVILAGFDHPAVALLFMLISGLTVGASVTSSGAVWAEMYGVRHLGAIRALVAACLVVSTAVSPAVMGLLIDRGVSMEALALLFTLYVGGAVALVVLALRLRPPDAGGAPGDR